MLTLDERWMEMSDEELGKHFFELWVILQAEKEGVAPESISPEFTEEIRRSSVKYDDENIEDIAIESALSHLAKSNWAKGANILRKVILQGAESIAKVKIAEKYVPFLPGKRKGAIKETTRYLKDLRAAYPNESAKNLYKIVLNESMEGNTPFQYDHIDGGLLYDGENEINMESFIKRLSKAKKK